mgnify:CR=1 FL=1
MTDVTVKSTGLSRRNLLKGAAGVAGLAAGSGAITGFPYVKSAERFRNIASAAGADIIIANHTNFDGTKTKLPALAKRTGNQKHPYVIGKEGVLQYMTVVDECAKAGLALQP